MSMKSFTAGLVVAALLSAVTVLANDHKIFAHFGAPAVNGHENVMSPDYGAIVFDTSDGTYWGYTNRAAPDEWQPMSGSSSGSVPTGAMLPYIGTSAPSGYVLASGRTIGNASSGGTERADADTEDLFTKLWTDWSNTELPIQDSSGAVSTRGASASADFAANKRLPLPDLRGRVPAGKDNMGGSTASRLTSAGAGFDATTMGTVGGSQTHTLTVSEMPAHNHPGGTFTRAIDDAAQGGTNAMIADGKATTSTQTFSGFGVSIASQGGGSAHQNTQPTIVTTYIIKL